MITDCWSHLNFNFKINTNNPTFYIKKIYLYTFQSFYFYATVLAYFLSKDAKKHFTKKLQKLALYYRYSPMKIRLPVSKGANESRDCITNLERSSIRFTPKNTLNYSAFLKGVFSLLFLSDFFLTWENRFEGVGYFLVVPVIRSF